MQARFPALLVSVLALSAPSALGQADTTSPLAGPEVEQVRPERLEQGLTMAASPGMQMGQVRQLPARAVQRLLDAMSADTADDSVRLTAEQQDAIRELTRAHQRAVREHRQEHADRIESLRIRGGLAPVRVPDDGLSETQRTARLELRTLIQSGPTDADLQARVFAALTDAQREHLNAEIDRLIEQQSRERRERLYADSLNAEPVDPETFFNDDGTVNLDALPERLRAQLTEVEEPRRAQRLRQMLERLSRLQAAPAAERVRPNAKSAPPVDALVVPDPEPDPDPDPEPDNGPADGPK